MNAADSGNIQPYIHTIFFLSYYVHFFFQEILSAKFIIILLQIRHCGIFPMQYHRFSHFFLLFFFLQRHFYFLRFIFCRFPFPGRYTFFLFRPYSFSKQIPYCCSPSYYRQKRNCSKTKISHRYICKVPYCQKQNNQKNHSGTGKNLFSQRNPLFLLFFCIIKIIQNFLSFLFFLSFLLIHRIFPPFVLFFLNFF